MKQAGILMPISSLPSPYGIGDFSDSAYEFIDFLEKSGQSLWQILPMNPLSYGDSPYQSPSAFAGNPYFISIKELCDEGLLTEDEIASQKVENSKIDYGELYKRRYPLLKTAFGRWNGKNDENYLRFLRDNAYWIDDYALFSALKECHQNKSWNEWPYDIATKSQKATDFYNEALEREKSFYIFLQYKFSVQWQKLKSYANSKGVKIIGDIPIYASYDSADVWAHRELFDIGKNLSPNFVAGCPPDGFSAKGQLWGNPVYNWDSHRTQNYNWWIARLKKCFELYDIVRIDHFRGFDEFYAIPFESEDATMGSWKKGPSKELFNQVEKSLGEREIIAEDLGFITPSVKKLLKDCGFMGIKVLQFAFDSRDTGSGLEYLPHNYPENCVAYTGTHDNQTIVSWFDTITDEEKQNVRNYLCDLYTPDKLIYMPLISRIMASNATMCIVPLQDYMGADDSARINTPGTLGNNWSWRITKDMLTDELANNILKITKLYSR